MTETELENAWLTERIAELKQRNARLTWMLRAIDARLHNDMSDDTLRQICNVIVSATAMDAPLPSHCLVCGSALEAVRPGKWQCNTCEARRFEGTWPLDDAEPGEE